ncbi:Zeatin O-glucosyltransferase [Capsicum annuum]|nr:Zeatin O-glucosyltransferase [Capsicum annuum]KAF3674074.1 Zeatin O-glucosyltransferase [Capsicum annuum]
MDTNSSDIEVIVAMVPFPDYSHNQDLKLYVQGVLGASNIHFEDLIRPSSTTEKDDAGRDPILMFLKKLREPIHKTCVQLSTNAKRLVLIHEFLMTEQIWNVHTFPNVKSNIFHAGSAFNRDYCLQQSIPDIIDDDLDKLVEQMHDEFSLLEPHVKLMVRMEHELTFHSGEVINCVKKWKGKSKIGQIEIPEGFEERVEGRGMMVNWAPQLEILRHSSTGVFLSHCERNSCIESISMGVPLATWPISYDQPSKAIYVTKLLKIGIPVRSWAQREELITASTIEKAVKTLMGMAEGEKMRQRAVELRKMIKSSVSHGGPARKEMESFTSNIIK